MAAEFWSRMIPRSAVAATLSISAAAFAQTAHAEKYASIVVDADSGEVLHARHEDAPRYPASLTKVMTLYLLFDALDAGEVTLKERMTVSRAAAAQPPSNLRLKAGDRISVEDAILALTTKSANDVAVVVAEHLAGTERRFATRMTEKGRELGMTATTFRNASGLPDTAQISTARDLAILADALLDNHAKYYSYFQTQRFSWGGTTYRSHNELVGTVNGVDGIKTGYTRASGFNLMTSAERDGRRIIAVMLGGQTAKSRNAHVADLVETAYASIGTHPDVIDPDARLVSFAAPVLNPNAAAEPMLNGRPISAILAEAKPAPGADMEVIEGDASEPVPTVAEVIEAPDFTLPNSLKVSGIDEDAAVTVDAAPAPPVFDGISVAEYEARQAARAAANASVSNYTNRQIRRR